jgi:putative glycosyltransferase (TIGR04372 family)
LLENSPPHLQFTKSEEARGKAGLLKLGLPPNAKFICLIGRDNAYLQTVVTPGGNFEYHDYRDVDINNFVAAVNALAEQGYYVIRMGSVVREPIRSGNPRVIDYATSGMRSDFLDVYLGAKCFFCISVSCGFDAIPTIFRRPVCFVNMVPIGYLSTFLKDSVAICKKHWDVSGKRWLTLEEVFTSEVGLSLESRDYLERNIRVTENSPEEIRDVVLEMLARLEMTWKPEPRDSELQERFWQIFPVNARSPYNNKPLHSRINLKYGSKFLRDNPAWLS